MEQAARGAGKLLGKGAERDALGAGCWAAPHPCSTTLGGLPRAPPGRARTEGREWGTALSHELSPQQHHGLPTKHVPEQTGKSCCFPPKSPTPVFPHQTQDSRPRVLVWLFTGEKEPEVWLAPVVCVKGILQQARKGAQWRRTKGEARFYPLQSQAASAPPLPRAVVLSSSCWAGEVGVVIPRGQQRCSQQPQAAALRPARPPL